MILDNQLVLSDAQTVTTGSSSGVVSTNAIDLKSTYQNIGRGENLYVVVQVDTALTDSSSDSAVTVELVDDDNSSLSSSAAVQTIGTFAALAAIGTRLVAKIAPTVISQRYVGVKYTSSNGDLSTGVFTAFVTKDVELLYSYPDAITIS